MRRTTPGSAWHARALLAYVAVWGLISPSAFAEPVPLPKTYSQGDTSPVHASPWWELLGEPVLTQHMESALRDNLEIQMAYDRLTIARASALQTASSLVPTVSADLNWSTQPFDTFGFSFQALNMNAIPEFTLPAPGGGTTATAPGTGTPTGTGGTGGTTTGSAFPDLGALGEAADEEEDPDLFHSGQYTITARWNIDLFGRQTMAWRASHLEAQATKGDVSAMILGVTGQIGQAYVEAQFAREQARILEEQLSYQTALLDDMNARYVRGLVPGTDLLQQRQRTESLEAAVAPARAFAEAQLRGLGTLLGQPPETLPALSEGLPALPDVPSIGQPSDLLRHRPDLVAAERRVEAARRNVAAAALGFAPTLAATASTGRQYTWLSEYDEQDFWSAGAQVSLPLFGGGARHAGLQAARANQNMASRDYTRQAWSTVSEVEAAVASNAAQRSALAARRAARDDAAQLLEQITDGYLAGVYPYLQVISAQDADLSGALGMLQAQRDALLAHIRLTTAVAGPWVTQTVDGGQP